MGGKQSVPEEPTDKNPGANDDQPEENRRVRLYINVDQQKWPILYSPDYDISFWGLEGIHPFDSSKWRRIFQMLIDQGMVRGSEDTIQPLEASEEDLLMVHTREYIQSLKVSPP